MNVKPTGSPKRRGYLPRFKMTKVVPHLTEEPGWEVEASSNFAAKTFVVLLVLHIVIVIGMLVYSNYKKNEYTAEKAAAPAVVVDEVKPAIVSPVESNFVDAGRTHVVVSGETPNTIAESYGVPFAALVRLNQLDVQPFAAGMPLKIPPPSTTQEAISLPLPSEYPLDGDPNQEMVATARFGDAAQSTAPVPVDDIPKALPVPLPTSVPVAPRVDDVPVPRAAAVLEPTSPREEPAVSGERIHTLKAGDTAYSLARKYGVSVEQLLSANGIRDPGALQIGRVLKIPSR